MKVLVACEMSGRVREAFRKLGHNAYSCDLLPSEIPSDYHIQDDVLNHLNKNWDLMISHVPCTLMCRNRARLNKEQDIKPDNSLFMKLWNSNIPRICMENPTPSKAANLPPYTQAIQPYQFGHDHSKRTCLWLKNLPLLQPTKIVEKTYIITPNGHKYTKGWYQTPRTSIARSRTFQGIADAMAEQWGKILITSTMDCESK